MGMTHRKSLTTIIAASGAVIVLLAALCVTAAAQEPAAPTVAAKSEDSQRGVIAIAVALVVGMGCLGAGVAVGRVGSAALGAVSENPDLLAKTLIFVGLAEGIAIYGLIVGIMLMRL